MKAIGEDMFGVVLWSDQIRNRAVIWCEDHGDLAFFRGDGIEMLDGANMEAGDLVQFDLLRERHMRLASNPRLVASDEYPTLARDLKNAGHVPAQMPGAPSPIQDQGGSPKIIAFECRRPPVRATSGRRRRAV